jgi:hypothetical protein
MGLRKQIICKNNSKLEYGDLISEEKYKDYDGNEGGENALDNFADITCKKCGKKVKVENDSLFCAGTFICENCKWRVSYGGNG